MNSPISFDLKFIQQSWSDFLKSLHDTRNVLYPILQESSPVKFEGNVLTLSFFYTFHKDKCEQKKAEIAANLSKFFQHSMQVISECQPCNSEILPPDKNESKEQYLNRMAEKGRRCQDEAEQYQKMYRRLNGFKVTVVSIVTFLALTSGLGLLFGPLHFTENLRSYYKDGIEVSLNLTDIIIMFRLLVNLIAAATLSGFVANELLKSVEWYHKYPEDWHYDRKGDPPAIPLRILFGCALFWIFRMLIVDLQAAPDGTDFYIHLAAWGIPISAVFFWLRGPLFYSMACSIYDIKNKKPH